MAGYPAWKCARCKGCAAGLLMNGPKEHTGKIHREPCTAPTTEEYIAELERDRERFRAALETLSGCMDNIIYVYGAYGECWSNREPDDSDEYEQINFKELLALE